MNMPKPFTKKKSALTTIESSSFDQYGTSGKDCINMEDLMQFEAARQRALQQINPKDYKKPFTEFAPLRIFINNIDLFNGYHIADFLGSKKKSVEFFGEAEMDSYGADEASIVDEDENEKTEDGEDMMSEGSQNTKEVSQPKISGLYEVIGTLDFINNPKYSRPEGIAELLDQEKKAEFLEKIMTCGFIIYDISSTLFCHPKQIEEAKWVIETIAQRLQDFQKHKPKAFQKYKDCRTFILISTLMTWAKTKPISCLSVSVQNPAGSENDFSNEMHMHYFLITLLFLDIRVLGDESLPLTERDYRKRKPHPNYQLHCELEKRVIELGKKFPNNLKTIVIGCGIPYGREEDILHFFFKMAWQGAPFLPIFSPGTNLLPIIHIGTLTSIVYSIIENFPFKHKYIVAAEPDSITLKELAKSLAKKLGNGKTELVSKEDAFLYPDVKQRNYDMLTANMNIVPGYIMDNPNIVWGSQIPFNENIGTLISEYKNARGLLPIKIFIHGPPASGKTFMAERLAEYYNIPHLTVKGVIEGTINDLKDKIKYLTEKMEKQKEFSVMSTNKKINIEGDELSDEEEFEEEKDETEEIEGLKERLKEIEDNMAIGNGKLDDEYVLSFFKEKMLSNECQNKGFIIDGYPKTIELTKLLYQSNEVLGEVGEDYDQGDVFQLANVKILPEFVVSLDASDEFLIDRVIKIPESKVQGTHYEEPDMCRRMTEFRNLNTEDNTPLIFYDEVDVHPMIYNIENDNDPNMEPTFQAIIHQVGHPRNYAKESNDLEDILEAHKQTPKHKQPEDMKAQREEIRKAAQERRNNFEKWMLQKNQDLEMEEKALLVMGMPLRHYLMKYIFPTLTRGLVEVARIRPDDPVDFLSEFLFRENPEGKMFQPNYEEREEKLAQAIKDYESSLVSGHTVEKKSSKKSGSSDKSARSDVISGSSHLKCSLTSKMSLSKRSLSSKMSGISSKSLTERFGSSYSKKTSEKSSSTGICTCRSPSLSTCSSDITPPTPLSPVSCTCVMPEPCEPCEPCDDEETGDQKEDVEPCKCPCDK